MDNILDLIPKDKFDITSIEKLKSIEPKELNKYHKDLWNGYRILIGL